MPKWSSTIKSFLSIALLAVLISTPYTAYALGLSAFTDKVRQLFANNSKDDVPEAETSQTIQFFKPVIVDEDSMSTGESTGDASSSNALQAVSGPMRVSTEDIDFPASDLINVYEVKKGDTLADVAKLFNVSRNTIIWANDLKSQTLTPGDVLLILPMTGIKHVIKKGDTVTTIAKKYNADEGDIADFNGVAVDAKLSVGDTLLVPDGELAIVTPPKKKTTAKVTGKSKVLERYTSPTAEGFLIRPLVGGTRTQGIHGHNGVDIAATPGTAVIASANGRVIAAKVGGYNGGYGNMVIIMHDGNIQTVYAHLKTVTVITGQEVARGQKIGEVGNTGRSTGPHLHFEVRGARNPF